MTTGAPEHARYKRLFISFRHEDCGETANRLHEHLDLELPGQVFIDGESIEGGERWADRLEHEIHACDAVFALIGPDWLKLQHRNGGARIHRENDWVRYELARALERTRDGGCWLQPLLVRGASMPEAEALPSDLRELPTLQPRVLHSSPKRDWDHDIAYLVDQLILRGFRRATLPDNTLSQSQSSEIHAVLEQRRISSSQHLPSDPEASASPWEDEASQSAMPDPSHSGRSMARPMASLALATFAGIFGLLAFHLHQSHRTNLRPALSPMGKSIRFVELDKDGVAGDLSDTILSPSALLDGAAESRGVPDPAYVDINSAIRVILHRAVLQPRQQDVLGEAGSEVLLTTKQRTRRSLDQVARALEQRTQAARAYAELMQARRYNTRIEEARRHFREARRTSAVDESGAIQAMLDLWKAEPDILARLDRAAQEEDYGPLLAVLNEELSKIDAADRAIQSAVDAHSFELRVSAALISDGKRTTIHVPEYDALDAGLLARRDRLGFDLSGDEHQRLKAQWQSTTDLIIAAKGVLEKKTKLGDALRAIAAALAIEFAMAFASAEQLEQSIREIPLRALIPDTRRELVRLADKAKASAPQLGQDIASVAEGSLRAFARSIESAAGIDAAVTDALDLARRWRASRPENLIDLLTRTTQLWEKLPRQLDALHEAFGGQSGAALRQLFGMMDDRTFTAVQTLLTESEAQSLVQRVGNIRQVWIAGQQLWDIVGPMIEGLPTPPQGELNQPPELRVPVDQVRNTEIDLSLLSLAEGSALELHVFATSTVTGSVIEELHAKFIAQYLGWNGRSWCRRPSRQRWP